MLKDGRDSLLTNLPERNGQKLYVPVEHPTPTTSPKKSPAQTQDDDDTMRLDDTKHKVYIYDLDAELSDSESDDGRLVFLPDIEKHLRETRIPPSILANSEGELAGQNQQLILYNIPSSLTVPEEKDSVRKAIIETRARARAKQAQRISGTRSAQLDHPAVNGVNSHGWPNGMNGIINLSSSAFPIDLQVVEAVPAAQEVVQDDPDAMDLGE
jgi:hypothetical protein